jgi:hypothetical protein
MLRCRCNLITFTQHNSGTGGSGEASAEAVRLIEERDFVGALELLAAAPPDDGGGENAALTGLAQFHSEDYTSAANSYAKALEANGGNTEWAHMLDVCRANAAAEVDVEVPDVHYFERDKLLAVPPNPMLPRSPIAQPQQSAWRSVRHVVGHAIGNIGGGIMGWLTEVRGKDYNDDVWTNWYRKRMYAGILNLAYMRDKLNLGNLKSTYPAGSKVAFLPEGLTPPDGVSTFRTADGTWNNLDDPKEGAAGTRFPRNVANDVIRPATDEELLTPDPRLISRTLLTRGDQMAEVPFLWADTDLALIP